MSSSYTLIMALSLIAVAGLSSAVPNDGHGKKIGLKIRLRIRAPSTTDLASTPLDNAASAGAVSKMGPLRLRFKRRCLSDPLFRHRLGGGFGSPRGLRSGCDRFFGDQLRRDLSMNLFKKLYNDALEQWWSLTVDAHRLVKQRESVSDLQRATEIRAWCSACDQLMHFVSTAPHDLKSMVNQSLQEARRDLLRTRSLINTR